MKNRATSLSNRSERRMTTCSIQNATRRVYLQQQQTIEIWKRSTGATGRNPYWHIRNYTQRLLLYKAWRDEKRLRWILSPGVFLALLDGCALNLVEARSFVGTKISHDTGQTGSEHRLEGKSFFSMPMSELSKEHQDRLGFPGAITTENISYLSRWLRVRGLLIDLSCRHCIFAQIR
jgi:hypothetical protein